MVLVLLSARACRLGGGAGRGGGGTSSWCCSSTLRGLSFVSAAGALARDGVSDGDWPGVVCHWQFFFPVPSVQLTTFEDLVSSTPYLLLGDQGSLDGSLY